MIYRKLLCPRCSRGSGEVKLPHGCDAGVFECECGWSGSITQTRVSAESPNGALWQLFNPPHRWTKCPTGPDDKTAQLLQRGQRLLRAYCTNFGPCDEAKLSYAPTSDTYHCASCGKTMARQRVEASWGVEVLPDGMRESMLAAVERARQAADVERQAQDEAPVVSGSVVGYRAWQLDVDDWVLEGTGYSISWQPTSDGIVEAQCATNGSRDHPAPAPNCHCGIYGVARFRDGKTYWQHGGGTVTGAIEAWGDRFYLHADGFRAQYAKVVLLAVDEDWPRARRAVVRALAEDYGADVCRAEHLEDAAREHGDLVSDELLAWARREIQPGPCPY